MVRLSVRRLQTAVLLFFVLGGVAAARGSFTLEQVMSSPFPTELVASHSGSRVAWVFDARGVRNIWVAEPGGGGYLSRQLTRYTQDDGQEIAELTYGHAALAGCRGTACRTLLAGSRDKDEEGTASRTPTTRELTIYRPCALTTPCPSSEKV